MTEQYLPTSVNAPRGSRLITEDTQLTLDDDLVVVETSGSSIALVLPDATQIPAREIKFKANTLTDPVVIGTVGGQTIDGNVSVSLTTDQETLCLKSDGQNWREVGGDGGGGGGVNTTEPISETPITGALSPTLAVGARLYQFDSDAPPGSMPVTLAPILLDDAGQGRRSSVILPEGNPTRDLVLTADAGQGVMDPSTFNPVAALTYPAGSFSGYTVIDLEAAVGAVTPVVYPATVISVVPDTYSSPFPNAAPVSIVITGTGGTLPATLDLKVGLRLALGSGGPPDITLAVTASAQGGGPGTGWTIDADIPIGALNGGFPGSGPLYALDIADGAFAPFAALLGAFGDSIAADPSQPSSISDVWIPDNTPSGAARWDETLALGPNTNGEDAYVNLEDEIVWSTEASPMLDPTQPASPASRLHPKASRRQIPIGIGAAWVNIGSAIHDFAGLAGSGAGNTIWIRAEIDFKASGPGGPVGIAVLEEIHVRSFGTWSIAETLVSSAAVAGRFRFFGVGSEIYLQALQDATFNLGVNAVIEWHIRGGYIPS